MSENALHLDLGGKSLRAVPAVHYRLVFAERVNHLCMDPDTRPDAIAVELGPETTAAAALWLGEIGVGPGSKTDLPCMLGLTRPNRYIRASVRDRAIRLQEATGKDLNQLPADLLKQFLGYSAVTVLYLSPTDSIIEAIRCSLELQVPLYGIDLEQTAEARRPDRLIEDPTLDGGNIEKYVELNGCYAASQRDEEIDRRREVAMAARLKTVLEKHDRVLFTCGLAHWLAIRDLLLDADLRPAPVSEAHEIDPVGFRRVVVHPLLAIYHMDVLPALTERYQNRRKPADRRRVIEDRIDPSALLAELLKMAYREHFLKRRPGPSPHIDPADEVLEPVDQLDRLLEDWEASQDFERLLTNLCLVKQALVPDIFTVMAAAQGTMSPRFCERLVDVLMQFTWAAPSDHPGLPLLAPSPAEPGSDLRAEYVGPDGSHGSYFFIDPQPGGGSYKVKIRVPWQWQGGPGESSGEETDPGMILNWPPIDQLLTAMSLHAMRVAANQRDRVRVEPFEGGLLDGLDIKATLRARSRGDTRFYIRNKSAYQRRQTSHDDEWDPVVWIFRLGQVEGADWIFMGERMQDLKKYNHNREEFRRVEKELGKVLVEQVGFGRRVYSDETADPSEMARFGSVEYRQDLQGVLLYSPSHFTLEEHAIRAENTEYRRNPICTYPNPYTTEGQLFSAPLVKMFRKRHKLDLNLSDWPTTMARIAIPYARAAITIVAPDTFSLPRIVYEEAARQGVAVYSAPHSYFEREDLRKIARWYAVPAVKGSDGKQFPEYLSRVFGEEPTANSHLIPDFWLNYRRRPAGK
jgi:hypothetical protein